MSFRFNPSLNLVLIRGELEGPSGAGILRLALDTGTSHTVLSESIVRSVDIEIHPNAQQVQLRTPIGAAKAHRIIVPRIAALGKERANLSVMTYEFPKQLQLDGLLGLDFLRNHRLIIDFPQGLISLG